MFFSLLQKRWTGERWSKLWAGRTAPPFVHHFRPELECLESRRLMSLAVGPNVNMSRLRSGQAEASIAMNPVDPNNLVAFSNTDESSNGVRVYASHDAGASWSTRLITNGDGLGVAGCCDTQAAFDN